MRRENASADKARAQSQTRKVGRTRRSPRELKKSLTHGCLKRGNLPPSHLKRQKSLMKALKAKKGSVAKARSSPVRREFLRKLIKPCSSSCRIRLKIEKNQFKQRACRKALKERYTAPHANEACFARKLTELLSTPSSSLSKPRPRKKSALVFLLSIGQKKRKKIEE